LVVLDDYCINEITTNVHVVLLSEVVHGDS
jgi:hypothetical protein